MASQDRPRTHRFEVSARWSADERRGEIRLGGSQTATISIPEAFGGQQPGTNPEELLLASALSCYVMTLGRMLSQRVSGEIAVEAAISGEVSRTSEGLHFDRIRLRPVVRGASADPVARAEIVKVLLDAEDACFIARTLRPVIPYSLEPCFAD